MYKVGITTFVPGSGYNQTAKNIDEKLAEKSKEHDQLIDASSIISTDYDMGKRIIIYKYEDK